MSHRIPPQLSEDKSYEQYRRELLAWKARGKEKKIGNIVASSLPENGERGYIRKYLDALSTDQLVSFDMVLSVLDRHLGMVEGIEMYEKRANLTRGLQTFDQYIAEFDTMYTNILEPMKPDEIFVYKFLIGANLSKEERKAVINGMNSDYENKGNLYELAKQSLKRFADLAVNRQTPYGLLQPGPEINTQQCPPKAHMVQHGQPQTGPAMMPNGCPTSNIMCHPHFQQVQHGQPQTGPAMMPNGYPTSNPMCHPHFQQMQHGQPQTGPAMMPNGCPTSNLMFHPHFQQMQQYQPYNPMYGNGYGLPMDKVSF